MHSKGTRMVNEQVRQGEVIRDASVEVWEFDQNGNLAVQQDSFEFLPGDAFRTKCYFRGDSKTIFGSGSQEEMCMAFLYYYPRLDVGPGVTVSCDYGNGFGVCSADYEKMNLRSETAMGRKFGTCGGDSESPCPSSESCTTWGGQVGYLMHKKSRFMGICRSRCVRPDWVDNRIRWGWSCGKVCGDQD